MWFWSSGFGPGPFVGTGLTGVKGCATLATRKLKNTPTPSSSPSAHGVCSAKRSRVRQAKAVV